MKRDVQGENCVQVTLSAEPLDDRIAKDNPIWVIDVLVEEFHLAGCGVHRMQCESTGRCACYPFTCAHLTSSSISTVSSPIREPVVMGPGRTAAWYEFQAAFRRAFTQHGDRLIPGRIGEACDRVRLRFCYRWNRAARRPAQHVCTDRFERSHASNASCAGALADVIRSILARQSGKRAYGGNRRVEAVNCLRI